MVHVHCSLCGANKPQAYLTLADRFSGKLFQLVKCSQCGLIYLTPRPSMEELDAYYPDDYEAYQPPSATMSASHSWHARRMWEMQAKYVMKFSPVSGKLLDVGCATGEFLDTIRQYGWQVTGLEVIAKAAQSARQRYQLEVFTGTLETVDLPANAYDVITLWDVLEHLPDPQAALRRCFELLKPGGYLFFSIPNLDSIDRHLFGSKWIGWDTPRHFTLFTHLTLKRILDHTGFSITSRDCFLGGKGTFLLSMDNVLSGCRLEKPVKKLYPLISAILWPYRQFFYRFKRGPILAVAAKKR